MAQKDYRRLADTSATHLVISFKSTAVHQNARARFKYGEGRMCQKAYEQEYGNDQTRFGRLKLVSM
jgi:hypothetical protein